MAHDTPTLPAQKRERLGSRYAHRLRKAGRLPAVVYGHGEGNVPVSVDEKSTLTILQQGSHLVNLELDGEGAQTCLVKELQFGFLGDNVIHIDFARVDLNEEVSVLVRLEFSGEPAAAKEAGAILTHDISDLEIVCKAGEIPESIPVDLSSMEQSISIGELTLPAGVRTELDPETSVAHIDFVAEEAEGEEVEVAAEAEPEVISEAKDDGEGAKPAPEGDDKS